MTGVQNASALHQAMLEDTAIIFGNDGPSELRTLLEIQIVQPELLAESIDVLGLATSTHDQTWVLLAASNDCQLLEGITWKAFWSAHHSLYPDTAIK